MNRCGQSAKRNKEKMMNQILEGHCIAILVANGFEQVEMTGPRTALQNAGAETHIISPEAGEVQGVHHDKPGEMFRVDMELDKANGDLYDALLLPGGLMSPDTLRMNPRAVAFVRDFVEAGKPVGAICHGAWLLAETGMIHSITLTSWPAIRTDLSNAGANWVDKPVVVDRGIVTSRKPADIEAFNEAIVRVFAAPQLQGRKVVV
jgi:protease I